MANGELPSGNYLLSIDGFSVLGNGRAADTANNATSGSDFTFAFSSDVPETLRVTSLTPTPSGFVLQFSGAIDGSVLNLFNDDGDNLGPADLTLEGAAGAVTGSLVPTVNPDDTISGIRFVATGGTLPSGEYTLTLRSADDAFVSATGELLDGDADGNPGGDFNRTFSISSDGVVIALPDFARGADQTVDVPADGMGLPLLISNGLGVTNVTLEIAYDPSLLEITDATVGTGVPAGSTVDLDTTTPGVAVITFNASVALAAGTLNFVTLTANVPAGAPLGAVQVLDVRNVELAGTSLRPIDDDAIHAAAYLADINLDGAITVADATDLLDLTAGRASGFLGYPNLDPRIVSDFNLDAATTVTDVSLLLNAAAGRDVPQIPLIP